MIRLTTPKLNFLIVSGDVLMYLSLLVGLLPTVNRHVFHIQCTVSIVCLHLYIMMYTLKVPIWLYGVGYLLVYGPILAKMWRVYQIFHNPSPGKKVCINVIYIKSRHKLLLIIDLWSRFLKHGTCYVLWVGSAVWVYC